jgi:KaiC/GvpD/RAD55 family RecA-like ATPase
MIDKSNGRVKVALDYLTRGWSVIPVGDDKKPLIAWKPYQERRATKEECFEWWTTWPGANIGLVTGKISGISVLDFDCQESIENFEERLPDSFLCPVARTPRGGRHYYFQYASDFKTCAGILPGVDIRNDGGYVVAAPSLVPTGAYEWICEGELLGMPENIRAELLAATAPVTPLPAYDGSPDPSLAELKELDLRDHLARFEGLVFNAKDACLCPVHAEKEPSFTVKRHTDGHWYWFDWHNQGRDGFSGTIIDYYVAVKGLSVGEAIRIVRDREGIRETTIGPLLKIPTPTVKQTVSNHAAKEERSIEIVGRLLSTFKSRETFYIMQDRIPVGMFTLLVGGGGAGKSTFLTELACRVSRGEPLPGAIKALVPIGSTIYITTENQPEEVFRPRVIACRGDLTKIIHVRNVLVSVDNDPGELQILDLTQHLPALTKFVDNIGDVRLVVVDPAISHVNERIDDSRAKPVRQLLDTLSEFAERNKITLIGVDHVAKGTASSAQHKAAGSHQWVDASRVALGIVMDKDDLDKRRRFLSMLKSNIYVTWKTLAFNILDTPVLDEDSPNLSLRSGRIEFETEEVDIDVESLFNPDKLQESMTAKAIRLLNNELKNGPRPEPEIREMAEALDIKEGTYHYARKKRGIHAQKVGGKFGADVQEEKWMLWLPEHWKAYEQPK